MEVSRNRPLMDRAKNVGSDMSPIDGAAILTSLARTAATPKDVIARYNAIGGERKKTAVRGSPRARAPAKGQRDRRSRLLQNAILLPEAIARQHIEIGAGDADHPGLLRMRSRMDHAGSVGFGLAGFQAISAHLLEYGVVLALRVDATPLGHFGMLPCVAVDRP